MRHATGARASHVLCLCSRFRLVSWNLCLVRRQPGDGGRQLFLRLDADDHRRRRLRLRRPVFSSGVYLAIKSVFLGADAVETRLDEPSDASTAPLRPADPAGLPNASAGSLPRWPAGDPRHFMAPRKKQRLEEAVLSVLADDVFGGSKIGQQLAAFRLSTSPRPFSTAPATSSAVARANPASSSARETRPPERPGA
jgi:hypothetical protein